MEREILEGARSQEASKWSRRVPCAESVPESDFFMPLGLALSEKQVPQLLKTQRYQNREMELLESAGPRPRQAARCHVGVMRIVMNGGQW